MIQRVYLDNSATTPIDKRVFEAMLPFLTNKFGNVSSIHQFGQEVKGEIDRARHAASALIGAKPTQIIFTSGGTEANNLAIRGFCEENSAHGKHIVTTAIEHPSVSKVCDELETRGFDVTRVPVSENGIISVDDVAEAIRDDTILVSVMMANNEIGTIQPIKEIGDLVSAKRERLGKIRFHTDAVQAVGKIGVDVEELGCDMLTFSGHKIYAPKGIGTLFVRRGVRIKAQNLGGHQERELRGGTENVAQIVAFGKACEIILTEANENSAKLRALRNDFENRVFAEITNISLNGEQNLRVPNISNISFEGVDGEALLINLDMQGIAVSTGSACSSGSLEPSPVILALGREIGIARSAVRFSFGKENSAEDIDYVMGILPNAVEKLRKISPNRGTR